MSNYLAIAAVTSTFGQWLLEKAACVLSGAKVTFGRPKEGTPKGINIFLYEVAYNTDHRNDDFPTRRSGDATFSNCPQAALDLYYLLTFYGAEKDLEPQILLGSTISTLHSQPVITSEMLRREIARRVDVDANDSLAKYEVSGQVQSIAFTPLSFNAEEFSKLWSVLPHTPYTLSVVYKASVVFVEVEVTPQKALPVLRPDSYVLPFRPPVIEKIVSADGEGAPVLHDSRINIIGSRLKGNPTKVSIGDVEGDLDPTDTLNTVTDTEIGLSLGSPLFAGRHLRAGIQGVRVLQPVLMGEPRMEHRGFESNIKPLVLCPTITNATVGSEILTIGIVPSVGKRQKVTALLNEFEYSSGTPHAYSINAPDNNGITDETVTETDSITFSISGVTPGDYLLRIQVDGAESQLEVSPDPTDPKYNGPLVSIP